ncbi:MAG: hypothetical protein HDT44_09200 [Ruminococcaceae bacterium]|nr:hypothetical protein [Oscillospiraceae bacterium]
MKLSGDIMLDKMSDVDASLIIGADNTKSTGADSDTLKIKRRFFITGAVVIAAMFVISIGVFFIPWKFENHVVLPDLPMLTVSEVNKGGFGVSAVSAEELKEIKAGLLGQKLKISEMPVYSSSLLSADTADKMREKLRETAEYFELDLEKMDIMDTTLDKEGEEELRKHFKEEYNADDADIDNSVRQARMNSMITASFIDGNNVYGIDSISIDPDMTVQIRFNKDSGVGLPEDYFLGEGSTPEQLEAAGRYLLNEYSELINMSDPIFTEYTRYNGAAEFYEKGADPAENIANQSIKHVEFLGENNKLIIIRIFEEYTLCEKIADYPIITEKEAEKLLRNGNYLSTINSTIYTLKKDDKIGLAQLTYRSGAGYECIMPFYLFYVRLPGEKFGNEEGDDVYGLFYVPAVRSEYLENMPAPAISFNGAMIN